MPRIRNRPGAFTLDLGQEALDQLNALVEYYDERTIGKIDKTKLLRSLVWKEFRVVVKKRSKKVSQGA